MGGITWRGDMSDDCTAIYRGLMLRAEQMDRRHWWWAVYDNEGKAGSEQLAASYDDPPRTSAKTGHEARTKAEAAARRLATRRE